MLIISCNSSKELVLLSTSLLTFYFWNCLTPLVIMLEFARRVAMSIRERVVYCRVEGFGFLLENGSRSKIFL